MPTLSIVIPVYKGGSFVKTLLFQINEFCLKLKQENYPLHFDKAIFVLDDPIDDSLTILEDHVRLYPWIQILVFSKNFGQHAATFAGMAHAESDFVVTLDEDLQHHPKHIISMIHTLINARADVVYAKPNVGTHSSFFRDFSSRLYKKIIVVLTGNNHVPKFNSFRLIRGCVSKAAAEIATHDAYLDIVLSWFTNRIEQVGFDMVDVRYVNDKASGYNFYKLLSHARRLIITTNPKFLRVVGVVGLISIAVSISSVFIIFIFNLFYPGYIAVKGWSSLFVAISFFGGLLAMLSSISLEYTLNILFNVIKKPASFIINRDVDLTLVEYFRSTSFSSLKERS